MLAFLNRILKTNNSFVFYELFKISVFINDGLAHRTGSPGLGLKTAIMRGLSSPQLCLQHTSSSPTENVWTCSSRKRRYNNNNNVLIIMSHRLPQTKGWRSLRSSVLASVILNVTRCRSEIPTSMSSSIPISSPVRKHKLSCVLTACTCTTGHD